MAPLFTNPAHILLTIIKNVTCSLVFLTKPNISKPMEEQKILKGILLLKKGIQTISDRKESR